jgi:hypothetical protein
MRNVIAVAIDMGQLAPLQVSDHFYSRAHAMKAALLLCLSSLFFALIFSIASPAYAGKMNGKPGCGRPGCSVANYSQPKQKKPCSPAAKRACY